MVFEGFLVEVVVVEFDFVNLVVMIFDEKGWIWVIESFEYLCLSVGLGEDWIKVLEDINGDGKIDKLMIFVEGLNIFLGIVVGYGGVWVVNLFDIFFMCDIDGDFKVDMIEVVVLGFGWYDIYELLNLFVWGFDGWLYGFNGVFNFSYVK